MAATVCGGTVSYGLISPRGMYRPFSARHEGVARREPSFSRLRLRPGVAHMAGYSSTALFVDRRTP